MVSKSQVKELANVLFAEMKENCNSLTAVKGAELKAVVEGTYDKAHATAEELINSVQKTINGAGVVLDGVAMPKYLSTFTSFEEDGKLSKIELTVKSRLKAEFPYKETFVIAADENFLSGVCEAYMNAVIQLLYIDLGGENLRELNDYIETLCAEEGLAISFGFALSGKSVYITSINDSKVVFTTSVDKAIEIADLAIFQSGDDYNDFVASSARKTLVESLSALQTTPQIIKANIDIIVAMTGVKTKKRAEKLIRGTYHKQAKHFEGIKSGFAYFAEDVEIGGETVSVFSLLEKKEDGTVEVVLKPFDTKSLFVVDFDVLKAI